MPVCDNCRTSIILCPVVAYGKAEFIRFAGSLAVECEFSHFARPATLHICAQAGVCDDEFPIIEPVVAYEPVDELARGRDEVRPFAIRQPVELCQCFCKSVGNFDVLAIDLPPQLYFVIAGNAECVAGLDHSHDEAKDLYDAGSAIHEIAKKDRSASFRVPPGAVAVPRRLCVTQFPKERHQLVVAPVNVTYDIERAVLAATVVVQRFTNDRGALDILEIIENVD